MFRVQDNVPEFYVNQSRDFQLFCRLYDLVFTGVRYSIDSMEYLTHNKQSNVEISELLQTKLGMFRSVDISDKELKYLLDAFPYIIRNKGNTLAIESVIRVFQRITAVPTANFSINYTKFNEDYTITIDVSNSVKYVALIRDMLEYVVPTGYLISVTNVDISPNETAVEHKSMVEIYIQDRKSLSAISNEVNVISADKYDLSNTVGNVGVIFGRTIEEGETT